MIYLPDNRTSKRYPGIVTKQHGVINVQLMEQN